MNQEIAEYSVYAQAADGAKEYGKSPVLVIRSKLVSSGGLNGVNPLRHRDLGRMSKASAAREMI